MKDNDLFQISIFLCIIICVCYTLILSSINLSKIIIENEIHNTQAMFINYQNTYDRLINDTKVLNLEMLKYFKDIDNNIKNICR